MGLDIKLLYFLNDFTGQSRLFDVLVVFLASYLQYFIIVTFLLMLYFSASLKGKKIRVLGVTIIAAIVARLGVTELIRFFYHRPRPFIDHQLRVLVSENRWSFPSGHSAFFFAMATAIYLYNKKWGVGFFVAAVLINVSRVIAGVHYPSDILGGLVVGILTAYVVFYLLESKKIKNKINSLINHNKS